MRALTTNEFIARAILVHGDNYDYSHVEYKNSNTKVKIICNYHGEICEQLPPNHLSGKHCCYLCDSKNRTAIFSSNNQEFIKKSIKIHGNRYDYTEVNYISAKVPVDIICLIHGKFQQSPDKHLGGHNCPTCALEASFLSQEEFLLLCNKIYGNQYDYSKTIYKGKKSIITIICKIHGEFEKVARNHINGQGCQECSKENYRKLTAQTTEEFVQEARAVHGNIYDYSNVEYIRRSDNVIIICSKHGKFEQMPSVHLSGAGCIKCSSSVSRVETEWLDHLGVPYKYRQKSIYIDNKKFRADAYDERNNIVYEFNGDYWHGNPKIYNLNDTNFTVKKTYKELYEETLYKADCIIKAGYYLISIWESDWKEYKKSWSKIYLNIQESFKNLN